jgi:adenylate cyclase class IV
MARNVEAKWRCADLAPLRERALALGAREAGVLGQTDTFFPAPAGRLKLREFADGSAELIAYRRPDAVAGRISEYHRAETAEPAALRRVLRYALGEAVTVRKRRLLLLHGNTRMHLDEVEGLGCFVELETVLTDGEDAEAAGRREFAQWVRRLALAEADLVPLAYADLLVPPTDDEPTPA